VKILGYEVTLSREPQPKNIGKEQGSSAASGAKSYQDYLDENFNTSKKPSVHQIMDMIDTDGTAAMLYSVITFPVLATSWRIDADPEDELVVKDKNGDETITHPQADLAEAAFRNPQHKGGMSTPFSLVLSEMLLALAQGYKFFEIVYKIDDNGNVVFKKLASRDYGSVDILADDTGGFSGVKQTVTKDGKQATVTIDLQYCFLFTNRKDRKKLKGMSNFTAAYKHYINKRKLYFLANQQAQASAINPKSLEEPDGVLDDVRAANLARVDAMAIRPSVSLPFGWKLNVHNPGQTMDMLPYIDHHDSQMARSLLAQMLLLGSTKSSAGGSYALSENHTDLFILSIKSTMMSIEEHINSFLIPKLHDYNFEKPLYSSFRFNDLSDANEKLLREAFNSLVTKGTLPQWITDGIAERVADQLDIEKPDDEEEPDDNDNTTNGTGQKVEQSKSTKVTKLAKSKWWRELTTTESKVNFSSIEKKANDEEAKLIDDLRPVFTDMSKDATTRLKPLLEEKGTKALDGFELKFGDKLQKVMSDHMVSAYSAAKNSAADEIKASAPSNKQKSKELIAEHTKAIVEKQYADMLFNLKTIVTDAVRKNKLSTVQELSVGDILSLIASSFSLFFDEKETLTASSIITTAINIGRDDVFQQFSKDIYAYQYSAILDAKVCQVCLDLDSSVVEEATYYATKWMPPIHFNCRCIWVAIMNDEEDRPGITGLPEAPGGTTEPSLSANNQGVIWHTKMTTK